MLVGFIGLTKFLNTPNVKAGEIKDVPFAEIADRALEVEQAEKDILDEEKAIRER